MKVFISHTRKDTDLARKVAAVLKEAGLDVWFDANEILPGENWAEKISDALKESEAMVVLLTPEALESNSVQWEIGYALGEKTYDKRLIPVIVGDPDEMPSEKIPWILRRLRMINLPERNINEEGIRQIATALREVA
ncbi:MAG: toll/interleukin-1 receptor domain-containing protein [Acidobacteriota bacterium]